MATPPPSEHAATVYKARGFHFFHPNDDKDKEEGVLAGSWWGERGREGTRPWHNPPKRRKTIPPDQSVAFERTKALVHKAADAVLPVAHEALIIAGDVLQVAPVVGLAEAARVLLGIWDAVEAVETNRMACLRLTERCATILYSVHAEIGVAGPGVADTLHEPVDKLTESFHRVAHFIHKQVSRPFLKRYLKRDEDARRIVACDAALTDSVGLFSVAIQIRMLRELQESHAHFHTHDPHSQPLAITNSNPPSTLNSNSNSNGNTAPSEALAAALAHRAALDAALDTADLYAAMRAALRMGSDVAMLDVLQINRGEMAEAIKTLQRALEDPRLSLDRTAPSTPQLQTQQEDALGLSGAGRDWVPVPVPVPQQAWGATQHAIPSPETLPSPHARTPTSRTPTSPYPPTPTTPLPTPTWDPSQDAAFHREFLESGLDALRRLSGTAGGESLPPWTITRWEVDRERVVAYGSFSDVWRGVWRGRGVAIKILAPTAPRALFQHEVSIWASLKHPHVLALLGASSAAGEPPWFFVSPYMKRGTVVEYLRAKKANPTASATPTAHPGPLQMMHEIAVGMAYLHRKEVLHGDLKANNVLIDDDLRCVIADFGQSELKSEVYRLSRRPRPQGPPRWQAPEILSGDGGVLTPEVDVYAFAVVCVEILTDGDLPWGVLMDDLTLQDNVLRHNKRPKIPLRPETSLALVSLIEQCWARDPGARPAFDVVARGLGHLVGGLRASKFSPSPRGKVLELIQEQEHRRSPDLAPVDLPSREWAPSVPRVLPGSIPLQRVVTPNSGDSHSENGDAASASEVFVPSPASGSDAEYEYEDVAWDGYDSPLPKDERIAARRDERRYRLLLQHDFNPSLNLPLWTPTPVALGAVGYLSKPSGTFVTLFNSYGPSAAGDERVRGLPSIYGYGHVPEASLRHDKRSVAQKGVDIIRGLLVFTKGAGDGTYPQPVSRRHSFPLRAGHKHAYICTENTLYRYMIDMDAAKGWFKANIREIVRLYGFEHNIQREDIFLVIGALETRDYALFVSHEHPDGQVHFNVHTDRREGQFWGSFTTDLDPAMPGPALDAPEAQTVHANKISRVRAGSDPKADAVLLARLRFKPDVDEPTRL